MSETAEEDRCLKVVPVKHRGMVLPSDRTAHDGGNRAVNGHGQPGRNV